MAMTKVQKDKLKAMAKEMRSMHKKAERIYESNKYEAYPCILIDRLAYVSNTLLEEAHELSELIREVTEYDEE